MKHTSSLIASLLILTFSDGTVASAETPVAHFQEARGAFLNAFVDGWKWDTERTSAAMTFLQVYSDAVKNISGNQFDYPKLCQFLRLNGMNYFSVGREIDFELCLNIHSMPSKEELPQLLGNPFQFAVMATKSLKWIEFNRRPLSHMSQNKFGLYHATTNLTRDAIFLMKNQNRLCPDAKHEIHGSPNVLCFTKLLDPSWKVPLLINSRITEFLEEAYKVTRLENLPKRIEGIETAELLKRLPEWIGPEAFGSLLITDPFYAREGLYHLTALEAVASAIKDDLAKVTEKNWIKKPIEPSSIWALEEIQTTKDLPIEKLAVVQYSNIYINPTYFVTFMDLYRKNLQATAGREVSQSIDKMSAKLTSEMQQIRLALNQVGEKAAREISELRSSTVPVLKSLRTAAWINAISTAINTLNNL